MFWTDWGEQPKTERAEMDGSNCGIVISQDTYMYSLAQWADNRLQC